MTTYKARRYKAGCDAKGIRLKDFTVGSDWARADLMKQIDEILVKALNDFTSAKYFNPVANEWQPSVVRNVAKTALTAWQAIKGEM